MTARMPRKQKKQFKKLCEKRFGGKVILSKYNHYIKIKV
jgi:hypothetical protein